MAIEENASFLGFTGSESDAVKKNEKERELIYECNQFIDSILCLGISNLKHKSSSTIHQLYDDLQNSYSLHKDNSTPSQKVNTTETSVISPLEPECYILKKTEINCNRRTLESPLAPRVDFMFRGAVTSNSIKLHNFGRRRSGYYDEETGMYRIPREHSTLIHSVPCLQKFAQMLVIATRSNEENSTRHFFLGCDSAHMYFNPETGMHCIPREDVFFVIDAMDEDSIQGSDDNKQFNILLDILEKICSADNKYHEVRKRLRDRIIPVPPEVFDRAMQNCLTLVIHHPNRSRLPVTIPVHPKSFLGTKSQMNCLEEGEHLLSGINHQLRNTR